MGEAARFREYVMLFINFILKKIDFEICRWYNTYMFFWKGSSK